MIIKGLTNNQLKIIAMISMLIDHIGVILFPQIKLFRIIGRIAFPIFAYMIAEGCTYTRNKPKYLLSLSSFGVFCQVFFFLTTGSLYMNILITFTLSVICIFSIDFFIKNINLLSGLILLSVALMLVVICVIIPDNFNFLGFEIDYGLLGVLIPVVVYLARNKTEKIFCTVVLLLLMVFFFNNIQKYSLMSVPFLLLYNGERGKMKLKYMFYIFYPTHLAVLFGINTLI